MILARYMGRILIRFTVLMALLIYLISFLGQISGLASRQLDGAGNPLIWINKLLFALSWASDDVLDFMPIIFMLASILTLITLGRRAELHIIRGVGLSGGRILLTLGMVSALAMVIVILVLRPLSFEAGQWADSHINPPSLEETALVKGEVAWISAKGRTIQGRLEGYHREEEYAKHAILIDKEPSSLSRSFLFGTNVYIDENTLKGTFRFGQTQSNEIPLVLTLDNPASILSPSRTNSALPLPHLLGWVDTPDRWALSERQATYFIMRILADPLLTAVLVLLAGTLCVEIGTRQPLARLIYGVLGFVIVTYSIYVVAHAFGVNGKLNPFLAAWGMPISLAFLGLALLAFRDLSWHFNQTRKRLGLTPS